MLYVVSFGPKKNRSSASFYAYKYALQFFNDCVSAGLLNVALDSIKEEGEEDSAS